MNYLMLDGFDLYNGIVAEIGLAAKWTVGSANAMAAGRFGGQCMTQNASNTTALAARPLSAASVSVGVGFAFKASILPSTTAVNIVTLFGNSGVTAQAQLQITATGAIVATSGTGTVLQTSAAGVITPDTWNFIEWGVTVSDTVGAIHVSVNGIEVINVAGVDTRNGTPTTVDSITFRLKNGAGAPQVYIDDLYVVDTFATLGERRIETLYADSDVATAFVPLTAGNNYGNVDEAQANGDTDYVQGTTVGDADLYGFGNLSSTPSVIDAVQAVVFAKKTDASTRAIAVQVKSGSTTAASGDLALAAGYSKLEGPALALNPNGAVAWTPAAVNALQGGPKVTV